VLGGGDVLSDFYLKQIPADEPFTIYGCGLGGEAEFEFFSKNQHRIRAAWVRNPADAERLRGMGINAHFSPDIVFQLKDAFKNGGYEDPAGARKRKRLVVFPSANSAQNAARTGDLRNYHYYEYLKLEMALLCDEMAQYYDIVFYPMSTDPNDNDHLFAQQVVSAMQRREKAVVMLGDDPIGDVVEMVRHSDLVLSMKFHGIVFSMIAGVPFLNIGLSRKTQLLCRDNALDFLSVPPYSFSFHSMIKVIKLAESPETRQKVNEAANFRFRQALEEGQALRSLILGSA
jgi:polysaccharide pyruvyl transferase WcaK-like protein